MAMKLTEKDFVEFELDNKIYWKLDCTNEMVQQILQNQDKAEICSNEECDGVLKWSTRFRESQQDNNQLKEELKSAVTLLDNTSSTAGKLKHKLERIKNLFFFFRVSSHTSSCTCPTCHHLKKLKEILEEKLQ